MTAADGKHGLAVPGRLRRVLAANPSPMTGPGTWTEIVGSGQVAVIDPGPALEPHLHDILAALAPDEQVVAIVVTHAHLDHSGLAPAVSRATGAPVLAYGSAHDGRSLAMQQLVAAGLQSGGEGLDHGFRPDKTLADGEVIRGSDWALRVVHTPGHLGGHLCLAWEDVLFSGDHVMGWAPSLVSPPDGDMAAYMASLARLAGDRWRLMLPAHGDPIPDPPARLEELIRHRKTREAQVFDALSAGPATLAEVTAHVYAGLAAGMVPAACRNALAHLIDLASQNRVTANPRPGPDAIWSQL